MIFTNHPEILRLWLAVALLAGIGSIAAAGPPDRIVRPVDNNLTRIVSGNVHPLAQPRFDRGAVDPATEMRYVILAVKPSAAQQTDLDALLAAQQNPSSAEFHKWLTAEEFGNRFGLSTADVSKVAGWLRAQGLRVDHIARSRNWLAFSGTAGQLGAALHTSFHTYEVGGELHVANNGAPSVPEGLAGVVNGFLGLNDFHLQSYAHRVSIAPAAGPTPAYTSNGTHYLAPQDFETIYDIAPLYKGPPIIDGTGQTIAIVGVSDVDVSDIESFRSSYGLPKNDPTMIAYAGIDPGYNDAQVEGTLDLEWSGAIAPNATIVYYYGPDPLEAAIVAVEDDSASIVSISYGGCEAGYSATFYRSFFQQGNAQGITIISAAGDSGAAGCDPQGAEPLATLGLAVEFPAVLPEVTGVGGTEFVEGSGSYWSATNSADSGSAMSYIPEMAWNESGSDGLLSGGGGASLFYSKPAWQDGTGVPKDNARDVPDIALSAATHDAYLITLYGGIAAVAGTSCGAPSMAGIVALLDQYEVSKGYLSQPGLGNINPQLYRLVNSSASAFHDITSGNNIVPCAQGSPDCVIGSFGYATQGGYDLATGLGSLDVSNLAAAWNTATKSVDVKLYLSSTSVTLNDTLRMTAVVVPASGGGAPIGAVDFSYAGLLLGSVALTAGSTGQSGNLSFPAFMLGVGPSSIIAVYSGDSTFSGGSATSPVEVNLPASGAAIEVTWPNTVWPEPADASGLSWQTSIQLSEVAGVPALVTSFAIDGQPQSLAQYFPSTSIPANGTVSVTTVFRDLTTPTTRTFAFAGTDASGNNWSRQVQVAYMPLPPYDYFMLNAAPLTVAQDTSADPSCQWAVQLYIDDVGGYSNLVTALYAGGIDLSAQIAAIFGTTRLEAYGEIRGKLCFSGITPPATDTILVYLSDGAGQELNVSFAGPPAAPVSISTSAANVNLAAKENSSSLPVTLGVNLSDQTQNWTASIFPANRTTAWLNASQLSGTGNGQITLTAAGVGFEPGVYRANIVIQSPNAVPQSITVPVMFVLGNSGTTVTGIANAASFQGTASPGMLLSVFGTKLSNSTGSATSVPLPLSNDGVTVTVNGLAAPILYQSSNQLNIQVPYGAGAGPAVVGVNNHGQVAGLQFELEPSAPGIFADGNGNLVPASTVAQGGVIVLFLTGVGDVTPQIATAWAPDPQTPIAFLPAPLLPLSATVAGIQGYIYFAGIPSGLVGTAQVNLLVPDSVPTGVQPLVVTVNGVSSKPVNLTVTAK